MTDLPTKDEIVGRVSYDVHMDASQREYDDIERTLDALTVPDLLALLRERGCEINFEGFAILGGISGTEYTVVVPEWKPDD